MEQGFKVRRRRWVNHKTQCGGALEENGYSLWIRVSFVLKFCRLRNIHLQVSSITSYRQICVHQVHEVHFKFPPPQKAPLFNSCSPE